MGEDLEITAKTLIQIGRNPNYAGVLVVGLGCERFSPYELAVGIRPSKKMVETVVIQKEGDSLKAIQEGIKKAREITGNSKTYHRMFENIDINVEEVIEGTKILKEKGEEIYNEMLDVASGKGVKSEILGHDELFCITRVR
ncbi:UxaA family hydrolase [Alteribacillus sp. JSM 102045]|uniref:UxaA family hydrolase n=1 Tax=Alteribacillus sp. JSM 102045 TaxID=1562101 RepID=UPI0035C1826B